ncbi:hypothetical protein Ac2012v2_001904 [Leucoagaricus gongylophorus]
MRINPHEIIPVTIGDKGLARYRQDILGIPSFHATFNGQGSNELSQYPGYPRGVKYAMKPQNRFQMWLREEMGEDEKVNGHYTRRFSDRLVEATTTVPLEPGADHNDLPQELQPRFRKGTKQKRSFFGRLALDGHFVCTLTQLTPGTKNAKPLHPNARRPTLASRILIHTDGLSSNNEW